MEFVIAAIFMVIVLYILIAALTWLIVGIGKALRAIGALIAGALPATGVYWLCDAYLGLGVTEASIPSLIVVLAVGLVVGTA